MASKACIYEGEVYAALADVAEALGIDQTALSRRLRKDLIDLQFITVAKYERLTGKQHPSRAPMKPRESYVSPYRDVDDAIRKWPVPRKMVGTTEAKASAFLFGLALGFLLAGLLASTAFADEYGSYCISKNGIERCTIWQWSSDKQRLIKKEIIRSS